MELALDVWAALRRLAREFGHRLELHDLRPGEQVIFCARCEMRHEVASFKAESALLRGGKAGIFKHLGEAVQVSCIPDMTGIYQPIRGTPWFEYDPAKVARMV